MTVEDKEMLINAFGIKNDCTVIGITEINERCEISIAYIPMQYIRTQRISPHDAEHMIEQFKLRFNK